MRIVAPELCDGGRASWSTAHDLDWTAAHGARADVEGAWLVHTATGDARVDADVAAACEQRRILCVNASDGAHGSARLAAETRSGDVVVGVVSDAGVDPRRAGACETPIAVLLREGRLPLRRRRATVSGRVDLVGGGPGPTDLMTIRGRRLLAEADVVVADRLGPTDVLADLDPDVEIIDVGKRPGHHPVPQDEINALLVAHARAGKRVVRLKGGDPFVYGRGGEEVAACLEAGIPVDVVPGLTSVVSVPQAAGIPMTHRGVAASVHIVNGQAEPTPRTVGAIADPTVTTVVLMGVAHLPRLVDAARDRRRARRSPASRSSRTATPRGSERPARPSGRCSRDAERGGRAKSRGHRHRRRRRRRAPDARARTVG